MTDTQNEDEVLLTSEATDEEISAQFPGQDPGHLRAMLAKAEGKGTVADKNADTDGGDNGDGAGSEDSVVYPDYIPEKFQTGTVDEAHAAMAAAHSELEAKLGSQDTNDNGGDGDGDGGDAGDGDEGDGDTTTMLLSDLEVEYLESDGKVSDATYEAMAKQGMGRTEVDSYIAGQQALADQLVSKVHTLAGGEKQYSEMLTWATNNWTPAEVESFDKAMVEGEEAQINLAVRGLKATFEAANGKLPDLLKGDADTSSTDSGTYASKAEMTTDMKDPRYKTDPAFRAQVARKLEHMEW